MSIDKNEYWTAVNRKTNLYWRNTKRPKFYRTLGLFIGALKNSTKSCYIEWDKIKRKHVISKKFYEEWDVIQCKIIEVNRIPAIAFKPYWSLKMINLIATLNGVRIERK